MVLEFNHLLLLNWVLFREESNDIRAWRKCRNFYSSFCDIRFRFKNSSACHILYLYQGNNIRTIKHEEGLWCWIWDKLNSGVRRIKIYHYYF